MRGLVLRFVAAVLLAGMGAGAGAQEFKGQVMLGVHQLQLDAGKLYEFILDSTGGPTVDLQMDSGQLVRVFEKGFGSKSKLFFMPKDSRVHNLVVYPVLFGGPPKGGKTDYTLKVVASDLAEKPILEEKDKWTGEDPLYQPKKNSHYKLYKLQLNAGKTYIIDLVKGGPGLDPYLYLEDSTGAEVASDDDSGGNLNAKIIYTPTKDGEYRIVATTLFAATGDFTLTVRQTK